MSHESPQEFAEEVSADSKVIAEAIGGWRGMVDGTAPTAVFLAMFVATGNQVRPSVTAALAVGVVLAGIRVATGTSLQQVVSGVLGLGLSAYLATRTGQSRDFFVLGLVQNAAYFTLCTVSLIVRRPVLGYIVTALRGQPQTWRGHSGRVRAFRAATWLWAMVFALRLAVTLPLYLAGRVAELATAKLVLGWPLYVLAVFVTFRIVAEPSEQ